MWIGVANPYDLLNEAVTSSGSWAAAIMRPSKSGGVLDCGPYVGFPKDWAHITNALDETTGNGRCFLGGKTVLIEDVPIEQPVGGTSYHYMSAIAVVPIKQGDSTIGTLEVIKDKAEAHFTPEQVSLLEAVAAQLAEFV